MTAPGSGSEASLWDTREAVEAWRRMAAERSKYIAPATERMFAVARIEPGNRVLDLGTGTGDTALEAARRTGPAGSVVGIDLSAGMMEGAEERAREAGLTNVAFRVMDAARLDLPAGSFDVVIGRQVLMFLPDPISSLQGIRRVLREGGRLAATVWSSPERNPFYGITLDVAAAVPPPPSRLELALAFGLPQEELLNALVEAGFRDSTVEAVGSERQFPSLAAVMESVRDMPIHRQPFEHLNDAQREDALRQVEERYGAFRSDGGVTFPIELLVVGAMA